MKFLAILSFLVAMTANAAYVQSPYSVLKGGTGAASHTAHGILFGEGSSPFANAVLTNNQLLLGVTGSDPVAGLLVNANVDPSAAIAYSKLNLSGSILNADINASAAIAYSKLNLSGSIVNADVAAAAAIAFSKLAPLTSAHILVGNGSNVATDVALSGDAALSNAGALTLATVNGNVGSFTNANVTVNAKGLVTAVSNGTIPNVTVADGGDADYTIMAADFHIRSGTTLTAGRVYTLPACAANIGERHEVKNLASQTFNITLAADGTDTIDGLASIIIYPGDSMPVVCGASGEWDIE